VHVPDLAQRPPHVSTIRICSSDAFSASAVARTASTTACRAASVATRASSLAVRAVSAAMRASSLAIRALSAVSPHPLPFLSNSFERLAMMITNLTRFFSESPELFRLASGSLGGRVSFGRSRTTS
jgi:hypothetical protein